MLRFTLLLRDVISTPVLPFTSLMAAFLLFSACKVLATLKLVLCFLLRNILFKVLRRHARKLCLMLTLRILDPIKDIWAPNKFTGFKETSVVRGKCWLDTESLLDVELCKFLLGKFSVTL